uniref:Uncharacterized protein n=1 Tax=Avena sativa TaxID=4498 RepID=A0ACD5VGC2_AVESA
MAASLGLAIGGHEAYYSASHPAALYNFQTTADPLVAADTAAPLLTFPQLLDEYSPPPRVHAAAGSQMNGFPSSYYCNSAGVYDDAGRRGGGGIGGVNRRPAGRIGFRTRSEVEVMDDGFRWRKYGKKAVKSSPNLRNYYRCSADGCGVKKRVERDRDDPRYVLTSYDGVHNHATPGSHGHGASREAAAYSAPAVVPDTWTWSDLHAAAAAAHSSESSY